MPGRAAAIAGLLAVTLLALSACQADTPRPSPASAAPTPSPPSAPPVESIDLTDSSYQPEAGQDGGAIVVGGWQEARQFNPYYLGQGAEPVVASAAWATLVTVTHDQRYRPDLATAIPTVDNGGVQVPGVGGDAMTVAWILRDGLKWSDGEPLTCDDFRYAWEWVLDEANFGVVTAGFEDVKDVECRSDTEMIWHLRRLYEGYLTLMTAPLPRHYLEAIPMADQTQGVGFRPDEAAKLPVSGPFRFESVVPTATLRMARNQHYLSPLTGRPAHLEALAFKWYADPAAVIAGYRAGEVGVAIGLTEADLAALADLGAQVTTTPSLTYEALRPNWSSEACSTSAAVRTRGTGCPLADPALRRAVALAIDRDAVVGRVLGGVVPAAGSNVDPAAWFHSDQPAPAFDPAAAGRLLEEAGWTDPDGDGLRARDGLAARIEICTIARQARRDTVALVVGWLKDVGIQAIPTEADPDDMFATLERADRRTPCALRTGNFDMALQSLAASIDPADYYYRYHSSQFEPDGQNDARVDDVGIDVALDTVRSSVQPAVIRDAMAEFQQIYVEQAVEIPLYVQQTVALRAPTTGNIVGSSPVGGPTWNVADWYVRR